MITLALGVLRIVIASLVLAFGFAGFAQAKPYGPSMMYRIEKSMSHGFEVLPRMPAFLRRIPFLSSQPHKARPKSQRQITSEDYDYLAAITPKDHEER